MAFITINGNNYEVLSGGLRKKAEKGGTATRAFLGNLRVTSRWRKRNWDFVIGIVSYAQATALEAIDEAIVNCSGRMLTGSDVVVNVPSLISLGDIEYVEDSRNAAGFSHTVAVTLREA